MDREDGPFLFHLTGWPLISLGVGVLIMAAILHGPLVGRFRGPEGKASAIRPSMDEGRRAAAHLLGGFRPLLIDLLWLRADSLFRAGRLWELAALFRSITSLDPRNRPVREFAAWHLAYNVTLAERDPDRRFEWFLQGVRILEGGPGTSRDGWKLKTFAGCMFIDRLDAEIIPGFEEKVKRRFGAHPFRVALRWLEDATKEEGAGKRAHVHLLACYERLHRHALEARSTEECARWAEKKKKALARARTLFPEVDWSFAESH